MPRDVTTGIVQMSNRVWGKKHLFVIQGDQKWCQRSFRRREKYEKSSFPWSDVAAVISAKRSVIRMKISWNSSERNELEKDYSIGNFTPTTICDNLNMLKHLLNSEQFV